MTTGGIRKAANSIGLEDCGDGPARRRRAPRSGLAPDATSGALRRRLGTLLDAIGAARAPSIDQLIDTMEAMMAAPHLTPDQRARLEARHQEVGAVGLARWQVEVGELVERLTEQLRRGTDPSDPAVQELAREWTASFERMVGGDKAILSSLYAKLDAKGPEAATRGVVGADAWDYLKRAFAVGFGAAR